MKRVLICVVILLSVLCACTVERVPPDLTIQSVDGDEIESITATMGTYSWDYGTGAVEADSAHPLDMHDIATIADVPETMKLVFTGHVIGYTVRRWVKGAEYEDFDAVDTEDNTIVSPDDSDSYIYEVMAEYKNGIVYYAFQICKIN